jgi:hypothetical protein
VSHHSTVAIATPLKDDTDASLLATLHEQGLLPEQVRLNFVQQVRSAALDVADASFLDDSDLGAVLTDEEKASILTDVEGRVVQHPDRYVGSLRDGWSKDYPPEDHFESFREAIGLFVEALSDRADYSSVLKRTENEISMAVWAMNDDYEPSSSTSAPTSSSTPRPAGLAQVFRDVDE